MCIPSVQNNSSTQTSSQNLKKVQPKDNEDEDKLTITKPGNETLFKRWAQTDKKWEVDLAYWERKYKQHGDIMTCGTHNEYDNKQNKENL